MGFRRCPQIVPGAGLYAPAQAAGGLPFWTGIVAVVPEHHAGIPLLRKLRPLLQLRKSFRRRSHQRGNGCDSEYGLLHVHPRQIALVFDPAVDILNFAAVAQGRYERFDRRCGNPAKPRFQDRNSRRPPRLCAQGVRAGLRRSVSQCLSAPTEPAAGSFPQRYHWSKFRTGRRTPVEAYWRISDAVRRGLATSAGRRPRNPGDVVCCCCAWGPKQ